MNEVVKFPINTPVEVTLESQTGEYVPGHYGGQVKYFLKGNRVMYVPSYVEQRFRDLAIGTGEPVLLCKRGLMQGNRHRVEWSVRRAQEPPQSPIRAILADGSTPEIPEAQQKVGDDANAFAMPKNEDGTAGASQTMTTFSHAGPGVGTGSSPTGTVKQEEQPRGNSTAPVVQESVTPKTHIEQQDNLEENLSQNSPAVVRQAGLSSSDSVFLPAMSMEVALARRAAIVEFTRRIMVKDQDFGEIPGASKPTLLKPGAEKLCNFFGLEPEFTPIVEDVDWTGAQHGGEVFCYVRYRCRLLRDGRVVGVGEGSCNSWESKYRYRWVTEDQVPERLDRASLSKRGGRRTLCEFGFAIERGDSTGPYGKPAEHWQRFREAIAAGTARSVEKLTRRGNSAAWEIDVDTTLYRIPNPDGADVVNTVQKMAQKRALVAATLIATSASEFFTQDIEDNHPSDVDAGGHASGIRQAQECVRDRKLAELRPQPPPHVDAQTTEKPWNNFGEMRQVFARLREQIGETRYHEELRLAGVENPGQFRSTHQALACYSRLMALAFRPEVA